MSEFAKVLEPEEQEEQKGWVVMDDAQAEWCIQKIIELNRDDEKWEAHFANQLAKMKESNASDRAFFESKLREYFAKVPHKATKTQESYQLPGGKLVMKKQEPEYDRNDEEVMKWAKDNGLPELVKTKESLDWAGLKKKFTVVGDSVVTEDGEIIPGIKVVPREEIFKVEVK